MAEPEGGGPEGVGDRGVDRVVVTTVVTTRQQLQLKDLQHPAQKADYKSSAHVMGLYRDSSKNFQYPAYKVESMSSAYVMGLFHKILEFYFCKIQKNFFQILCFVKC